MILRINTARMLMLLDTYPDCSSCADRLSSTPVTTPDTLVLSDVWLQLVIASRWFCLLGQTPKTFFQTLNLWKTCFARQCVTILDEIRSLFAQFVVCSQSRTSQDDKVHSFLPRFSFSRQLLLRCLQVSLCHGNLCLVPKNVIDESIFFTCCVVELLCNFLVK